MDRVNHYEIVLVKLDPEVGSEMTKTKPSVVLSPNEMNKYQQTIVVVPMTNNSNPFPTCVKVKHTTIKEWIAIDQI